MPGMPPESIWLSPSSKWTTERMEFDTVAAEVVAAESPG
jgi:hypothetical protein